MTGVDPILDKDSNSEIYQSVEYTENVITSIFIYVAFDWISKETILML